MCMPNVSVLVLQEYNRLMSSDPAEIPCIVNGEERRTGNIQHQLSVCILNLSLLRTCTALRFIIIFYLVLVCT